jgi:hypothetical protein
MNQAGASETLIHIYQATQRRIPESHNITTKLFVRKNNTSSVVRGISERLKQCKWI